MYSLKPFQFQLQLQFQFQAMRNKRPQQPPPSLSTTKPPPPPPTPPQISIKKLKRALTTTATTTATSTTVSTKAATENWALLDLTQAELSLPLTLPTGQTFRWKRTAPLQYTGTLGPHLISLKHRRHLNDVVLYKIHRTPSPAAAKSALLDFLNADVSLSSLWSHFSSADPRFAELATHLKGARVLRQDPVECLIQFLCSSNNNIKRITKMVDHVSSLGARLGSVEGVQFHEFPSLERLASLTERELREAGFGYRAKYIIGTVAALQSKPGGGAEWLASLRKLDLPMVIDALCTLPGVGPKVAACIALFSLDQHHAIPVDTHVWQIASKYLLPELAGARLTPKLSSRVADTFVSKYGKYAGWAQTLLFIAELPSQKALLPSQTVTLGENISSKKRGEETQSGN